MKLETYVFDLAPLFNPLRHDLDVQLIILLLLCMMQVPLDFVNMSEFWVV